MIKKILILLLIALVPIKSWALYDVYIKGEPTNPAVLQNQSIGDGEAYKDIYFEQNKYYSFSIGDAQRGAYAKDYDLSTSASGYQLSDANNYFKYTEGSGVIRVNINQHSGGEYTPYVWLRRPLVKLKYAWNGAGTWYEQDLTDQHNGLYSLQGQYGGNAGFNIDCWHTEKGDKELGYFNSSYINTIGSPSNGDNCHFIWDSKTNHLLIAPTSGTHIYNMDGKTEGGADTTLRLIATSDIAGPLTYTFTVTLPGESQPSQIQVSSSSLCEYTCSTIGNYTFHVTASHGSTSASSSISFSVHPSQYYLRYSFNNDARKNVEMTYNAQDGTYYYFQDEATADATHPVSIYDATWAGFGANSGKYACVEPSQDSLNDGSEANWIKIGNENELDNSEPVIFHYDPHQNIVWITASSECYRIESNCGSLGTFYSNIIYSADKAVSLFATSSATLSWQSSPTGLDNWSHKTNITPLGITKNGIYTVTPSALQQADLTFREDSLPLSVYCGAVKDSVMVKFTTTTYYDHYLVKFLEKNANIGATVGNATNSCIAKILPQYTLPQSANVRFEYDSKTNKFTRTLVGGSTYEQFLHFYPTQGSISTSENNPITESSPLKMKDASDWVYYSDVKVNTDTDVKATIYSHFNGTKRWILAPKGTAAEAEAKIDVIPHETPSSTYTFRITYDFKTNRLICGWLPNAVDDVISGDKTINSNIIITREALTAGAGPSIFSFNNLDATVRVMGKVIFELDIDKDDLFTTPQGDKTNLFQVTLPFDVNLADVYGLDNYGERWAIQDYKGELRALLGMRQPTGITDVDPIDDFWGNLIWTDNTQLLAGRGYVISHNYESHEFNTIESTAVKRLYFPSASSDIIIKPAEQYTPAELRAITCNKPGREQYDGGWRVVGVPGFYEAYANGTADPSGLQFFYEWAGKEGVYTIHRIRDKAWQPTKNYMIQYNGNINWATSLPSPVAARNAAPQEMYRLLLTSGEEMLDQAFVRLSADGTNDYVMGDDLLKIRSGRTPQLWTETQEMALAANTLPDTTHSVTLCVKAQDAEEYTISLTSGNHAQDAILYDAVEQTYTNLSQTGCYTFTANADTTSAENRFTLLFSPRVATNIEATIQSTPHQAIKTIENGHIVIWKDGVKYDALGKRF